MHDCRAARWKVCGRTQWPGVDQSSRSDGAYVRSSGRSEKRAIAHARLDAPLLNVPSLRLSRKLDETRDVLLNVAKFAFQLARPARCKANLFIDTGAALEPFGALIRN
jgi:hypothetical protein